jgi:hypothetical protein
MRRLPFINVGVSFYASSSNARPFKSRQAPAIFFPKLIFHSPPPPPTARTTSPQQWPAA